MHARQVGRVCLTVWASYGLSHVCTDIGDLPADVIATVREWFRIYKVAEGKGLNRYALNGDAVGKVPPIAVCLTPPLKRSGC